MRPALRRSAVAALAALALGSADAQRAARSAAPTGASITGATTATSTGGMVAGGLAGAAVGMAAGLFLGDRVDRARGYDGDACPACTRWGAGVGATLGTTLGVAIGVHLANRRRGRLATVLLRTSAAMLPFWAASYAAGEGWDMLAVIAGVGTGVAIATRAERRSMPAPAPSR